MLILNLEGVDLIARTKTAITILNWNSAAKTIKCLDSVKLAIDFCERKSDVQVYLLDNGSEIEDWHVLQNYSSDKYWINLSRSEINTGFAGGHNNIIAVAIKNDSDYIWVLNNDTVVEEGCLFHLIELMESDHGCGAVSPVVYVADKPNEVHVLGGVHRWESQKTDMVQDISMIRSMEHETPLDFWITGAAMLLRVSSLKKTGIFDESFFAYYEDNDLCARMTANGYRCRIANAALLAHESPPDNHRDRKPYYFYLMARNEILFWLKNTPQAWRRPIRYRLLSRIFTEAYRLEKLGYKIKSEACLNGAWDGVVNFRGAPPITFKIPVLFRLWFKFSLFLGKPNLNF